MGFGKCKSFTLIELIVVMAVMGLVIGGLLVSLRQIVESENLFKKMQAVEEESRFIMDVFTQDAEYSELKGDYKAADFYKNIAFILTEKKSEIGGSGTAESSYSSSANGSKFYLKRTISGQSSPDESTALTLNNTPLASEPLFLVKELEADEAGNYFITISLTFRVDADGRNILVPIETSVVSRTFEL